MYWSCVCVIVHCTSSNSVLFLARKSLSHLSGFSGSCAARYFMPSSKCGVRFWLRYNLVDDPCAAGFSGGSILPVACPLRVVAFGEIVAEVADGAPAGGMSDLMACDGIAGIDIGFAIAGEVVEATSEVVVGMELLTAPGMLGMVLKSAGTC